MTHPLARRSVLTGGLLVGGAALGACSGADSGRPAPSGSAAPQMGASDVPYGPDRAERIDYGPDATAQFGELRRSEGPSKGVVVVIHGGFWRVQYDLSLGQPLAQSLAEEGWTAYNIEYRRVGNDGGWPGTFDDVAAAIDALADVDDVETSTLLTLGHSAGGHLAVWAAARRRFDRWRPARVPVTGCVSQAGVLDLAQAYRDGLGGGAVEQFLGRAPGEAYNRVDPARQLPLDVPVRCIHGRQDTIVPIDQSRRYVDAATAAGADASLTAVDGDHFTLIDPETRAWEQTLGLLEGMRT